MSVGQADFLFFREWLRRRAAILLEDGKEYLVESRLEPVARKQGLGSVDAVLQQLRGTPTAALELAVVEALTTNETSFFRDWKPFEALRQLIVPAIQKERISERRLDLWSAACSSGQEAYSVGMLLAEHFPALADWQVRLHCTDISREMLERTRAGRFSTLEVNRGLPAPLLLKHFTRDGDAWVVKPALRALLSVSHLNLAGPWPALPPMDVVMIRNVLIYFDVPTKKAILERVRRQLRLGGVLFLGSAETTMGLSDAYRREEGAGTSFYRAI
ncbi:MAG: protein-glutamate O-methyltransferase CheR [Anaeromyxobacter sp.]|nr:protein-glutamate O-methyltransferase CheR [Anaeromyxobacter sp.]